jgi:hypothetical protein
MLMARGLGKRWAGPQSSDAYAGFLQSNVKFSSFSALKASKGAMTL